MTISPQNALMLELNGDGPLSPGTRAFLGTRARQAVFDLVHQKLRTAQDGGLTRENLARRIGKDPGRLSNTLSSPGNWELDTIAILLFGICKEEFVPKSRVLLGRPAPNMRALDNLEPEPTPAFLDSEGGYIRLKGIETKVLEDAAA